MYDKTSGRNGKYGELEEYDDSLQENSVEENSVK